jgi:hypothetical protein
MKIDVAQALVPAAPTPLSAPADQLAFNRAALQEV